MTGDSSFAILAKELSLQRASKKLLTRWAASSRNVSAALTITRLACFSAGWLALVAQINKILNELGAIQSASVETYELRRVVGLSYCTKWVGLVPAPGNERRSRYKTRHEKREQNSRFSPNNGLIRKGGTTA